MPIDFSRIVNVFQAPMRAQMKTIAASFEKLAAWIRDRTAKAQTAEQATRGYPSIDFYNEAITVRIARFQQGLLGSAMAGGGMASPSFWRAAIDPSRLGRIPAAVTEELAIPRYLLTLGEMLETIVESIRRFEVPSPEMFNLLTPRRISDIFGQAALFLRAIPSSRPQIHALLTSPTLVALMAPSNTVDTAPGRDLGQTLREAVQYLAGAILLVPTAGLWIDAMVRASILSIKAMVLAQYEAIEAKVFRLRRAVIDFVFVTIRGVGEKALDYVYAAGSFARNAVDIYGRFAMYYGEELLRRVRSYAGGLSDFLRYWTRVIEGIRAVISAIMDHDFGADVASALGIPNQLVPRLTLDDIVSAGTGRVAGATRQLWTEFLDLIDRWPINRIPGVGPRIGPLRQVIERLLGPSPPMPETALPPRFTASLPDIGEAFFGAGAPDVRGSIRAFGVRLTNDVVGTLDAGATLMTGVARQFSAAAAQAARMGSVDRYRLLAEQADRIASGLFAHDRETLLARIAGRRDPLAAAFDAALVNGGFHVIADVIPLYVGAVRDYWDVSPHILARRAKLGRVTVPSLTIRATGRELDGDLAALVAARFKGAVEDAYRAGVARLQGASAAGTP